MREDAQHVIVARRGLIDVYRVSQWDVTRTLDDAARYTLPEAAFLARPAERPMTVDEANKRRLMACAKGAGVVPPTEGREPLEEQDGKAME